VNQSITRPVYFVKPAKDMQNDSTGSKNNSIEIQALRIKDADVFNIIEIIMGIIKIRFSE